MILKFACFLTITALRDSIAKFNAHSDFIDSLVAIVNQFSPSLHAYRLRFY